MPAAKVSPSMSSTTALNGQSIKSIKCDNPPKLRSSQTTQRSDSNDSSDNSTDKTGYDNSILKYCELGLNEMKLTPYQKILRSLESDERWQRDITLGRRVGFYRFRGDIGSGNFSQVKVALHCLTREKVAVKIMDKSKLDTKTRKMLLREISSMEGLHHPNIINIFEVIETLSKIHLVMEYAPNGELFQYITKEGRLNESHAKPLFAQIVAAIDHMHNHNIIHRDIKAENIFFSDLKTIKVGDFGFSTCIERKEELLSTFCGSPPYAAPELFNEESYIGPYVDYWALGVLLYFMVTSSMPFKAQTISALKKLIIECYYEVPEYLTKECNSVINALLQTDCHQRWDLKQLKECQWLVGQTFPPNLPQYKLRALDTDTHESNVSINPEERQAYKQIRDLGIDDLMIKNNLDKGSRSSVTASFRIIINRIIRSQLKRSVSIEKDNNENIIQKEPDLKSNCNNNDIIRSKSSKSISKSIKSIKNIFIDRTVTHLKAGESSSLKNESILSESRNKTRRLKKSKTCCLL